MVFTFYFGGLIINLPTMQIKGDQVQKVFAIIKTAINYQGLFLK
jgi:hypothetical protein